MPKKQANPVDGQVGNRVRLRRMLIGMSQERLGELLGLTFQQVQKYEKGVNRIGAGRLYQVAQILGVPINYFYEGVTQQSAEAIRNGDYLNPARPRIPVERRRPAADPRIYAHQGFESAQAGD